MSWLLGCLCVGAGLCVVAEQETALGGNVPVQLQGQNAITVHQDVECGCLVTGDPTTPTALDDGLVMPVLRWSAGPAERDLARRGSAGSPARRPAGEAAGGRGPS
jgi:hypothetical protein